MRRESKFVVSCVWSAGRLRLRRNPIPGRLRAVRAFRPCGLDPVPGLRQPGHCPQRTPVSRTANGAHWPQAGLSGNRDSQMPVRGLRQTLRGRPPFAPAYAHYTHRLEAFVNDLRGLMTVSDLAAVTGLSWDTVKHIVKHALEKDYGHPRLKDLRYLSIDEIYLGRDKKYRTLVIDLESGRIVYVAQGKGAEALRKFWRALRLSKAQIAAVTMDMSAAYWAAVAENLPDAAVVFDRFHIVKLVNEKLDDLRRALVREATGRMKQTVKGIRYLLLTRRENVGPDQF